MVEGHERIDGRRTPRRKGARQQARENLFVDLARNTELLETTVHLGPDLSEGALGDWARDLPALKQRAHPDNGAARPQRGLSFSTAEIATQ